MKGASPKFGASRPLYNYNIDDEHSGVVATLQEEDDLKHICMGKKELQDFKDDKSLTVDYSFDDDHTMTNKQNLIFKEKNQMINNDNKDDNIIMTTIHPQQLSPSNNNNHKKTKTNVLWKFIGGDNSFDDNNQELHRKHHTNDINNYISDENFFAFKERDYNPHHHLLSNRNDVIISNDNISGIENISEVFPHNKNNIIYGSNSNNNNNNQRNSGVLQNNLLNSDNIENLSEMYQQHRKDIEADLYQDDYGDDNDNDNFNEMSVHDNNNNKQTWPFGITHNELVIIGKPTLMNSVASYGSVPSFGISRSQKIEKEYIELKKSYDDVLNLLQYWHGFYKDILDIVEAKKVLGIDNDELNDDINLDSNEFMQNVIKTVKDLVFQAKNKVYRIFTITVEHNFVIWGNNNSGSSNSSYIRYNSNNNNNNSKQLYQIVKKVNNFKIENNNKCFNKYKLSKTNQICLNINNTFVLKNDDENNFPPILLDSYKNSKKHPLTSTKQHHNTIIQQEFTYEYTNTNTNINNSFPSHKTQFDKAITTCIENTTAPSTSYKQLPLPNPTIFKRNTPSPFKSSLSSSHTIDTPQYKVSSPTLFQIINKRKKTTSHEIQTDLNTKHLDSIELMNKEYSTQLAITQKDKEKMQKLYEDKINLLTIKIEQQQQQIQNTQTSIDSSNTNTLKQSTSSLFLPELIPPEQTYKIFIHCIKHFKYEETLYKKFMEEADLQCMKVFVAKMEKLEQAQQHNKGRTTKNYVSKYLKLKHNNNK